MLTVNDQAALLLELAEFERTQLRSSVSGVHFDEDHSGATLETPTGRRIHIPARTTRQEIFAALRPHESGLEHPSEAAPEFVADPKTAQGVWTELLLDLGASLHLMKELVPGLRVASVRREGTVATVPFHAGGTHRTFTLDLASGQEPCGVAIDWAFEFRGDASKAART